MLKELRNCIKRNGKWESIAKKAHKASVKRRFYADLEQKLLACLKRLSEDKNSASDDFMFTATSKKGSVDYKEIPQLKGINIDHYRKSEVISWELIKI